MNTYTSSSQTDPSISSLDDGGFIITWADSSGHDGGSSNDIRGQLYDDDGDAVGEEFLINTEVSGSQYEPSVASLKEGGLLSLGVTMTDRPMTTAKVRISGRRYLMPRGPLSVKIFGLMPILKILKVIPPWSVWMMAALS